MAIVHAVADIDLGAVGPKHVAREMVVGGPAAPAIAPEAETPVLLVALHLAVGADDFVALVHRTLEVLRGDPVVVKIDAHPVLELHAHLDGVVGVDPAADETLLLTDRGEGDGLALVVAVNEVGPVRPDVAEGVALLLLDKDSASLL